MNQLLLLYKLALPAGKTAPTASLRCFDLALFAHLTDGNSVPDSGSNFTFWKELFKAPFHALLTCPHVVLVAKAVQGARAELSKATLWILNPPKTGNDRWDDLWGQSGLMNEASLWRLFRFLFDWLLIKAAEIKASTQRALGSSGALTNRFAWCSLALDRVQTGPREPVSRDGPQPNGWDR